MHFFNHTTLKKLLFFELVFLFFFLFYSFFHPASITTPDDWFYISYTRDALPLLSKHNPTRILPEVLMPLVSTISSLVLRPLGIDIISAISYGTATLLALLITIYSYNLYRLVQSKFALQETSALAVTSLFLLFHFLIFRSANVDNPYLLGAFCLTNYYYYTIPTLICATLVLYCIRTGILARLSSLSYLRQGGFFCIVYFCLLSNLYSSIILAVYFFIVLIKDISNHGWCLAFRTNKFCTAMLLFYIFILGFEANGDNANNLTSHDDSFLIELRHTMGYYCHLLLSLNNWFVAFCVIIFGYTGYSLILTTKEKRKGQLKKAMLYLLGIGLINIFIILISAKAQPNYVAMSEKMLGEFCGLLVCLVLCVCYIIKNKPQTTTLFPLLFLLLFFQANSKNKTYEEVYGYGTMTKISEQLVDIVRRADSLNVDSLTLYVPKIDNNSENWPFLLYVGPDFATTFYCHRLTRKRLVLNVEAREGQNTISSSIDFNPHCPE